jgi:hypothetical protein
LSSRTCFFGTMPARFSWSKNASYACVILASLQLLIVLMRSLHGLDKDGIAIDFRHNHDVFVASSQSAL